nr:Crp/Fnr family transcriptional regulator [uncultured Holophaga sp.]
MKFLDEDLLDHLQRPEFAALRASLRKRIYPKGALVARPSDDGNAIFIVVSGRVRVFLGYEDKEFNLGILARGDIYSTHSGTYLQALSKTELIMTDVATFRQNMAMDPEVMKAMVRVLGHILKTSFSIIDGLAFKDVNHRLVALISREARRNGVRDAGGAWCVTLDISVEQIARLVGSTRQTVSTLLNDLERLGLLNRPGRGLFAIPSLEDLEVVGGLA